MGRAVGAHKASPVKCKAHGQVLQCDIMDHLIIAALQEGRIDRAKRLVALGRQSRGKGHRMLFGNADIEGAGRINLAEPVKAGAGRHRRGNGDDLRVMSGFGNQALGKNIGVGGRIGLRLGLRASHHIEGGDTVIFIGRGFSRCIAFALLRDHMQQDRTCAVVTDVFENRQQMVEIMAVDRTDIKKAQLLEQGAACPEAAGIFFGALGLVVEKFRQFFGQLLGRLAETPIGVARHQSGQIGRHRAGGRGNRHVIVVEDDN